MRLREVVRGDSWRHRTLIRIISRISGIRLPDAARALTFLEALTLRPSEVTVASATTALRSGMSADELSDAAAVGSVFNIITRYASALDFAISTDEYAISARMLVKRGYM